MSVLSRCAADVFPNDPNETQDTDSDGVGDNADVFPNDPSESQDSDNDGVGDNADVFPNDPSETMDSDGDGFGDNIDAFPNNGQEWLDSDNDGTGDNSDVFPLDPSEISDLDNDGIGDNSDTDIDGDGVFNDLDEFPLDPLLTGDLDNDGIDNLNDPDIDGDGIDNIIDDDVNGDGILDILQANNAPTANQDNFSADETREYIFDVAANDVDIDGDRLAVVSARAELGTVELFDGDIVYTPPDGQSVIDSIVYKITDGELSSRGMAYVNVNTLQPSQANIDINAPADIEVNATGLFTEVDLGQPSAFDASGRALPIRLRRDDNRFAPGLHRVYWETQDETGTKLYASQQVKVHPLVSFGKRQLVEEGQRVRVKVRLNGDAPSYPVTVNYAVRGSADTNDHDARDGSVVFQSGRTAEILFNTFNDDISEIAEKIEFRFVGEVNAFIDDRHIVTLSEDKLAPKVELHARQRGVIRSTIGVADGDVTVQPLIAGVNGMTYSYQWSSSPSLNDADSIDSTFSFDPSLYTPQTYMLSLVVTASDPEIPSIQKNIHLTIRNDLRNLSNNQDADGDGLTDASESYADRDLDAIPDYLDSIIASNVLQSVVGEERAYLLESATGTRLRLGRASFNNGQLGARISSNELVRFDTGFVQLGGIFDYEIQEIPIPGLSTEVVIPLTQPLQPDTQLRKLSTNNQWNPFVENDRNLVFSAKGSQGFCPPPDSLVWQAGLQPGYWCVRLTIQDGGPNDADQLVNANIVDPLGISLSVTDNQPPIANDDFVQAYTNQVTAIQPLDNDTDPESQALTLIAASSEWGDIEIVGNGILFTPNEQVFGVVMIDYEVQDAAGGVAFARIELDMVVNQGPTAVDDQATTLINTPVDIDVLANDTDTEGDEIRLIAVQTNQGDAVIMNKRIRFTPAQDFTGTAIITYTISDGNGEDSTAEVRVFIARNYPPRAVADAAETNDSTAIIIDVLANDSDPDGDSLTITSVQTTSGTAVVENNQIRFTPQAGNLGQVTVTYVIADSIGNEAIGNVNIQVTATPVVEPPAPPAESGGGGSVNALLLLFLGLIIGWRRHTHKALH